MRAHPQHVARDRGDVVARRARRGRGVEVARPARGRARAPGRLMPSCGLLSLPGPRAARRTGRAPSWRQATASCGRRPRCRSPGACARLPDLVGVRMISAWTSSRRSASIAHIVSQRTAKCGTIGWRSSSARRASRGSRAARRRPSAGLEQVVDVPVQRRAPSARGSPSAAARSSSSRASAHPLLEVGRSWQQRGVAALQRDERARAGRRCGGRARSARALSVSTQLALAGEVQALASRACSCTASASSSTTSSSARLEQRDALGVDRAPPARSRTCGPSAASASALGQPVLAGELRRRARTSSRALRLAAARLRAAEREQQPAAARVVARAEPLERVPVVLGGLLVGERRGRRVARPQRVVDRLALAVEVAALEVVVGELGGRRAADLLQRPRDPVVQRARGGSCSGARRASRARARARRRSGRRRPRPRRTSAGVGRLLERRDDPLLRLVDAASRAPRGRTRGRPPTPRSSSWLAVSVSRARRVPISSLTPSGTPAARRPRPRLRSVSLMKNGLPSVSRAGAGRRTR